MPTTTTIKATKIRAREKSCGCGCQGRDPWHARYFSRVVREAVEVEGPPAPLRYAPGCFAHETHRGVVKLPWGTVEVRRTVTKTTRRLDGIGGAGLGSDWELVELR